MDAVLNGKKQAWIHAIRPRTLPLALSSILMASFIAAYNGIFRWEIFLLSALTTILLQILSNLSNDYGDSVHGADSASRKGPIRAVQSGIISPTEMKQAMYLLGGMAFVSGLTLLYLALQDFWVFMLFLFLGLLAIYAAITYTSGTKPYGYLGFGDVSVFAFFGLLGVLGTYYLHGLSFSNLLLLPAVSLGCFSTSVLNINNIRDIDSDREAGKKSIPVRIGRKAAVRYNWALVLVGNLALLVFVLYTQSYGALLALLATLLMVKTGQAVQNLKDPIALDPYLKKMAIATLVWVLLFGTGLLYF
ncbi:1,4-dihydroxy-2-naphthoate polyprenyltransferase [Pararhodonellum marinum]|uniref:1,4-dihydroxy-2-naphthoate polyprenyltransferase n=1 Tax=Pararhodonellum marinum TaxID=2755358 RepID=UPI00188FFB89|nr:1,4-dihydroxy-2-naphthoate polyprenyltransferase [Pararhodonellum marinum]